jgi:hypothetical protein
LFFYYYSKGTNATVSIVLNGKNGSDSGERVLDGEFNRGETSVFALECADLGDLSKIRIGNRAVLVVCCWLLVDYKSYLGHDNSGFGAGWFLDKVIVKDKTTNKE